MCDAQEEDEMFAAIERAQRMRDFVIDALAVLFATIAVVFAFFAAKALVSVL
jgi:hypothetical protein